jgi:hypothetical protein
LGREELRGLGAVREDAHRTNLFAAAADEIDRGAANAEPAARHRLRVDDDVRAHRSRRAQRDPRLTLRAAIGPLHAAIAGLGARTAVRTPIVPCLVLLEGASAEGDERKQQGENGQPHGRARG